jgi:hypothetical protein
VGWLGDFFGAVGDGLEWFFWRALKITIGVAVVAAVVVAIKNWANRPAPPPPMQRFSNLESDGRHHRSRIAVLESQLEEMRYENGQLEEGGGPGG